MIAQQQLHAAAMETPMPCSGRSSMSDTVCGSDPPSPVVAQFPKHDMTVKDKKSKKKDNKRSGQTQPPQKKQTPSKTDKPFYQQLGEDMLKSTRLYLEPAVQPLPTRPPPPPPVKTITPLSNRADYFFGPHHSNHDVSCKSKSTFSLPLPRKSTESDLGEETKIIHDVENPSVRRSAREPIYSLKEFSSMVTIENLVLQYGRVAHMGVRDHSYRFWMNNTRTAVVHFKLLNKVAVLGGDPLCHHDHIAATLREFEVYCKRNGWKVAIIGASSNMARLAKQKGWTCMNFGTERVLNPQTNEVLLGQAGKRITTQCKQLLDPARGGVSLHTYTPSHGRNATLEESLKGLYDDWRNQRNGSGEAQAFVTVFDLFSMNSLMTFLYTTDRSGQVNGFAALRKLGAVDGYHIDPFIQNTSAPRGTSDLLIFASLAFLNVQGCSYLALGYEPVTEINEIWGLPSILHSTTKRIYKHVFGKIPVGGKGAFHARWKPDETQPASLYLIFVGKLPSPRYMFAAIHFANVSFRKILASDWQEYQARRDKSNNVSSGSDTEVDIDNSPSILAKTTDEPKSEHQPKPTKPTAANIKASKAAEKSVEMRPV